MKQANIRMLRFLTLQQTISRIKKLNKCNFSIFFINISSLSNAKKHHSVSDHHLPRPIKCENGRNSTNYLKNLSKCELNECWVR